MRDSEKAEPQTKTEEVTHTSDPVVTVDKSAKDEPKDTTQSPDKERPNADKDSEAGKS
ncbi:hypothetical protein [Mycobacterium sp. JS623]|uniref:hypothetical protein n=1 Tax=Mycobacterium sp. JS623 TaxID=212767 RepID=UPI00031968C5|nr:hypothetical protein [Mycobacterium sp. JS623]